MILKRETERAGAFFGDNCIFQLLEVGVGASNDVKTEDIVLAGYFLLRDQRINVSFQRHRLDGVGVCCLRLRNDVKTFGRLPMSVESILSLNALIATKDHLKSKELPDVVDQVLKGAVVLRPGLRDAFLDVVSKLTNILSVVF
jgi:hypothetical protein